MTARRLRGLIVIPLLVPAAPGPAGPEVWQSPLTGRPAVLRGFDPPDEPWLAGHRGVDLAAPAGSPVRAAGPGRIGYAGPLAGRGVVVVLHPRGTRTTYLPVRPAVRRGADVSIGDVIGHLEDRPGHCPVACLHWGLIRANNYRNPLAVLGRAPVRLLPYLDAPPGSASDGSAPTDPVASPAPATPAATHDELSPMAAAALGGAATGLALLALLGVRRLLRRSRRRSLPLEVVDLSRERLRRRNPPALPNEPA